MPGADDNDTKEMKIDHSLLSRTFNDKEFIKRDLEYVSKKRELYENDKEDEFEPTNKRRRIRKE